MKMEPRIRKKEWRRNNGIKKLIRNENVRERTTKSETKNKRRKIQ